jgi:hypothetical protein
MQILTILQGPKFYVPGRYLKYLADLNSANHSTKKGIENNIVLIVMV